MREQQLYLQAGYKNFSEYCQRELYAWGGYRRINQLLGAKKVIDAVGELGGHIKNERQARPLLRLVKEPEKLKQAVAIALKDNPSPSVSDFAAAANIVVPQLPRKKQSIQEPMVPKIEEPVVPQKAKVRVSQQSHPRYGEEGTIEADAPNRWQQIVTFADGERLLINNADLDAASVQFPKERTYPAEYTEAMSTTGYAYAAIEERHRQELERLEQDLRVGLLSEATANAEEQVQEQIQSLQNLYKQQREENVQLRQRLNEMESLRQLEAENQQLQQRIQELERAVEERPSQQWGNTMTQQATKALNKQVKQALEKTIDLRSLAQEPPKENAQECLRLMGMALKNLASAMNNTQALEAAALILGSEATPSAIAYRAEQLQMIPQAVSDIRRVLSQPGCTWQDYWAVAQKYEVIKQDYWAELTTQETDFITALGGASPQSVESVSEKDLPVAMDCTSLTLVDAAPSQSTSLLAEKQDCGVEARDCYEGTCSAASPAQIEKSSTSAIADQKIEPSRPSTSLMIENSISGGEVKAVHQGESFAVPVLNAEKWSHEAIVARSNVRPERMQKLKVAANSGQNPGFDFLQECWSDDPALRIVIKKLLAKFPQWGVACVDGVLVDWER